MRRPLHAEALSSLGRSRSLLLPEVQPSPIGGALDARSACKARRHPQTDVCRWVDEGAQGRGPSEVERWSKGIRSPSNRKRRGRRRPPGISQGKPRKGPRVAPKSPCWCEGAKTAQGDRRQDIEGSEEAVCSLPGQTAEELPSGPHRALIEGRPACSGQCPNTLPAVQHQQTSQGYDRLHAIARAASLIRSSGDCSASQMACSRRLTAYFRSKDLVPVWCNS